VTGRLSEQIQKEQHTQNSAKLYTAIELG